MDKTSAGIKKSVIPSEVQTKIDSLSEHTKSLIVAAAVANYLKKLAVAEPKQTWNAAMFSANVGIFAWENGIKFVHNIEGEQN